jgi:tRNA (adenine57-N1/adenine58-N1)-methyltransferase
VPTVLQLARQIEGLNRHRAFSLAQGFEALQRYWHVSPPSVRPRHGMRGHTGFIITARRRWRQA